MNRAAALKITPAIEAAWGSKTPLEQPLIEWARQLQDPAKNVVDAGAHVGDWTVDMAAHSARVYAFEAQMSTYEMLLDNCRPYANITCHHVALSEHAGTTELRISTEDGGGSSINHLPHNAGICRLERVATLPLDAFELRNISLLKLDVEGAEIDLVRGALQTLEASNWPKIIFEAWSYDWWLGRREELFRYLRGLGYRVLAVNWTDMYMAER